MFLRLKPSTSINSFGVSCEAINLTLTPILDVENGTVECRGNETTLSTDILLSNYWGTREQFVQVSPHVQEVLCNIRSFFLKLGRGFKHVVIPICSMYGRCTYIYHKFKVNVGKSSYGIWDIYPLNWKPPMPQQTKTWGSCWQLAGPNAGVMPLPCSNLQLHRRHGI